MNAMSKPAIAADELAIFVLSKMYGKHTIIYNKARPWSTLDPPYLMSETELHDNCQIHLVYVGKDSYGILRHKPFTETIAPLSVETMLEPMKLRKTSKGHCQNEPWDLSIQHSDLSVDVPEDRLTVDSNNTSTEHANLHDEELVTPISIPEPGENVEISSFDETAIPVNKHVETADLCYSMSEVKLYRLTNSELEKYLGKMPNDKIPSVHAKGDNTGAGSNSDVKQSPSCTAYSRSCRPLRTAASKPTYVDAEENDSDVSTAVLKGENRTSRSKPSSSGPSASRIAAQNKRTRTLEVGLKPSKVYKRSNSPTYSITSSGASECHSDHDENDSDVTFDGFEPLTEEDQEKLTKLGKLRTVEYGLKKRKRVHSYICHEGGCTFVGKSIRKLNEHHIKSHKNVLCESCNKSFKTPSSLKRHSYSHGELKFPCDQCDEAFAFQSELTFHKTVHRNIPTFKCLSKNCNKVYKSANELNKHILKHSRNGLGLWGKQL